MSIIFFDLETSDKDPCGQILNYSFIRTNDQLEFEDELSGEIRISVLQLPSPFALLTNRVRVLDHQRNCNITEPEAALNIVRFIEDSITVSKTTVYLVGFNSSRFDIGFLRTTLIRNGINPYFGGKLKYHDILFLVRKAFLVSENFPVPFKEGRLSLSLESVTKALGLLESPQTHHSRDDVLLSIDLCRRLKKDFSLDLTTYKAYEASSAECCCIFPNYEMLQASQELSDRQIIKNCILLSENYRNALWLDLKRYKDGEGRAAISWFNKAAHQLVCNKVEFTVEEKELALKAKKEFKDISVDNFFQSSSCDIEQDIYRLDMQKIASLHSYIWENDKKDLNQIKDDDFKNLATRFLLAYGIPEQSRGKKWQEGLRQYAKYRYGENTFQLSKSIGADLQPEDLSKCYHPSLKHLISETERLEKEAKSPEDAEILKQLKEFITQSDLFLFFE
jgi:hypothetical protein